MFIEYLAFIGHLISATGTNNNIVSVMERALLSAEINTLGGRDSKINMYHSSAGQRCVSRTARWRLSGPPFATPERKRTIEHAVCTLYCLLTPRTRAPARADVMRDGYVRDCAVLSARASPGIRSKCVGALLFHLRANTPAAVVHRNSDRTSDYSTHRQHSHTLTHPHTCEATRCD